MMWSLQRTKSLVEGVVVVFQKVIKLLHVCVRLSPEQIRYRFGTVCV